MGYSPSNPGTVWDMMGYYDKSMPCFLRSLEIPEKLNFTKGIGHLLENLTDVYCSRNDFKKAALIESIQYAGTSALFKKTCNE